VVSSRPSSPDPKVLWEALKSVAKISGLSDYRTLEWLVGERIERRSSTLFPLRMATPAGGAMRAFYKISHPRPHRVEAVRAGLARTQELSSSLMAPCDGEGIQPAPVLAADPGTLTVVTLALPGRPLGLTPRHVISRNRRQAALGIFRRIGKAIRLIELSGKPAVAMREDEQWGRTPRDLQRVEELFSPREAAALGRRLKELYVAAAEGEDEVFSHGDMRHTNVLVSGEHIGLVDLQWQVRLRGFDLAYLAVRIEYETVAVRPWTSALVAALVGGYGDPEIRSSPSWRFYRLRRLIRRATHPVRGLAKGRVTVQRARKELRAELEGD
jgi:hypothetical protein